MCKEYNGWSNYETWNANLWMTNEEGVDGECLEKCKEIVEYCKDEQLEKYHAVYRCSEALKDIFEQLWFEEVPAGPMGDAVGCYLTSVNWQEIAEHYVDAAIEELEYDKEAFSV